MWVNLLKGKDEAFGAFKKFQALVVTRETKKKTFKMERGGEFVFKEFTT